MNAYSRCSRGASPALLAGALLAGLLAASPLRAQTAAPILSVDLRAVAERPIDALKADYLACDRAASTRVLSFGEAAHCSTVSEALLQRGFGRDFAALLAWWRTEREATAALSPGSSGTKAR
jgi:hypothetical protein